MTMRGGVLGLTLFLVTVWGSTGALPSNRLPLKAHDDEALLLSLQENLAGLSDDFSSLLETMILPSPDDVAGSFPRPDDHAGAATQLPPVPALPGSAADNEAQAVAAAKAAITAKYLKQAEQHKDKKAANAVLEVVADASRTQAEQKKENLAKQKEKAVIAKGPFKKVEGADRELLPPIHILVQGLMLKLYRAQAFIQHRLDEANQRALHALDESASSAMLSLFKEARAGKKAGGRSESSKVSRQLVEKELELSDDQSHDLQKELKKTDITFSQALGDRLEKILSKSMQSAESSLQGTFDKAFEKVFKPDPAKRRVQPLNLDHMAASVAKKAGEHAESSEASEGTEAAGKAGHSQPQGAGKQQKHKDAAAGESGSKAKKSKKKQKQKGKAKGKASKSGGSKKSKESSAAPKAKTPPPSPGSPEAKQQQLEQSLAAQQGEGSDTGSL